MISFDENVTNAPNELKPLLDVQDVFRTFIVALFYNTNKKWMKIFGLN